MTTPPFPFGQEIVVHRPGGTSWNGDLLPGSQHTIGGCAVWQNSSTEDQQGRDTIVTTKTALVPNRADIAETDLVYLPGDDRASQPRWQVTGTPHPWQSPLTGMAPGTEVELTRVSG